MFKNKIFNLIVFTSLIYVLFFISSLVVKAEEVVQSLPDNVKITTDNDGSNTTVIINSKPGFTTNVQTSCVNGKCTHSATSKAVDQAEIKKMEENMKKQQEIWDNIWKQQEEIFKAQQKLFQDLWGVNEFF